MEVEVDVDSRRDLIRYRASGFHDSRGRLILRDVRYKSAFKPIEADGALGELKKILLMK